MKEYMKIKPTIGRIVWYYPEQPVSKPNRSLHCAAIITDVLENGHINIAGFRHDGTTFHDKDVRLVQEGEKQPGIAHYCTWMPYQVGQAKKQDGNLSKADLEAFKDHWKPIADALPKTHEFAQCVGSSAITPVPSPTVKDIDDDTLLFLLDQIEGCAALDKFPIFLPTGGIEVNKAVLMAESLRRDAEGEHFDELEAELPVLPKPFEGVIISNREKEALTWAWGLLTEIEPRKAASVSHLIALQAMMFKVGAPMSKPAGAEATTKNPHVDDEDFADAEPEANPFDATATADELREGEAISNQKPSKLAAFSIDGLYGIKRYIDGRIVNGFIENAYTIISEGFPITISPSELREEFAVRGIKPSRSIFHHFFDVIDRWIKNPDECPPSKTVTLSGIDIARIQMMYIEMCNIGNKGDTHAVWHKQGIKQLLHKLGIDPLE